MVNSDVTNTPFRRLVTETGQQVIEAAVRAYLDGKVEVASAGIERVMDTADKAVEAGEWSLPNDRNNMYLPGLVVGAFMLAYRLAVVWVEVISEDADLPEDVRAEARAAAERLREPWRTMESIMGLRSGDAEYGEHLGQVFRDILRKSGLEGAQ